MPSKTIETNPAKVALEALRADLAVFVNGTVKDGHACSAKEVLGEITASKLLRRRTKTLADGAGFAINSAVGTVEDASKFKAGDVLQNAAGQNIGTVAVGGINTVTNQITLTANAAVAVADGAAVLGSDGSQVARCISGKGSDGNGDTPMDVCISAIVNEADIIGLDATAKDELGGKTTVGGLFKF